MAPRISVCQLTTPDSSLADDLAAHAADGATGIGLCEAKLSGDDAAAVEHPDR